MIHVQCRRSMANCYEEAAKTCAPRVYKIVNQADESGVYTNSSGDLRSFAAYSMLVACGGDR